MSILGDLLADQVPCQDCGASAGHPCDDACPSASAAEIEYELAWLEQPACCPSAAAAVRRLCGCGGPPVHHGQHLAA